MTLVGDRRPVGAVREVLQKAAEVDLRPEPVEAELLADAHRDRVQLICRWSQVRLSQWALGGW